MAASCSNLRLFRLVMLSYFSWDLNMATACYTAELLLPFCLETDDLKAVSKRYHCFHTLKMELLRTVKEVEHSSLLAGPEIWTEFCRCWIFAWWRKASCWLSPPWLRWPSSRPVDCSAVSPGLTDWMPWRATAGRPSRHPRTVSSVFTNYKWRTRSSSSTRGTSVATTASTTASLPTRYKMKFVVYL